MTRMSINTPTPEDWDALRDNNVATKSIVVERVSTIKHIRSTITTDPTERKAIPIHTTLFKYWPDAVAALAECCVVGGAQHGQEVSELHWDRSRSGNELDAMMRHVIDKDWEQVAWRAMANLEKQLEKEHN